MKFSTALLAIFSVGLVAATPVQPIEPRATVGWNPPNTYKKDQAKKDKWEGAACTALNRAGCAGGTIQGGAHKSPPGRDQREHVQVKPDGTSGETEKLHVYEDGSATKFVDGQTINVRDTDFLDMME